MVILVTSSFVQRIAIGSVGECGALVANCKLEYSEHVVVDGLPLGGGELITASAWVNSGQMQNFGGIEVANAGDGALIEQGYFDGAFARIQTLTKFRG